MSLAIDVIAISAAAGNLAYPALAVTEKVRAARAVKGKAIADAIRQMADAPAVHPDGPVPIGELFVPNPQSTAEPAAEDAPAGSAGQAAANGIHRGLTTRPADAQARRDRYRTYRLQGFSKQDAADAVGVLAETTRRDYETWYVSREAVNGAAS